MTSKNEEIKIEATINSLSEFTNFLLQKRKISDQEFVYRGEEDYPRNIGKLTPYIFRGDKKRVIEKDLINGVINERPHDFENSESTLDILLKMQHYGLPTRLLDVSFNPYKALYFALENPFNRNDKADGYFYLIDKRNFKEKPINSDTVSIVSSISRLSNKDKKELSEIYKFYLLCKALSYKLLVAENQIDIPELQEECSKTLDNFKSLLEKLGLDEELLSDEGPSNMEQKVKGISNINHEENLASYYQNNASIRIYGIPNSKSKDIQECLNYILIKFNNIFSYDLEPDEIDMLHGAEMEYLEKLKRSFNEFSIVQKLLHEVRNFNPGFTNELNMDDLVENYLILPRNTNQRIINQEGGFILSGLNLYDSSIVIDENKILRIKIPSKSRKKILDDLEKLHSISESYIYPELDHYNYRKFEQNVFVIDNHRIKIVGNKVTIYSFESRKKISDNQTFLVKVIKKIGGELKGNNTNVKKAMEIFNILYDKNESVK